MEEAGQIPETAEEDVDKGVDGADTSLDPDCEGWEEDGDEAEEDIGSRHFELQRT